MIHVECHMLNLKTLMPTASYTRVFTSTHEFTEFYKQMSAEKNLIMNIRFYDPQENDRKKSEYDVKLYGMSREVII